MADGPETAITAAEDQGLASARHAARCARRFWAALTTSEPNDPTGGDIPDDLAEWAFRAWWLYWLDIEPADLEDVS